MFDPKQPHHYPTITTDHTCQVNWTQRLNSNVSAWHYCTLETPHPHPCLCICGSAFLPANHPAVIDQAHK